MHTLSVLYTSCLCSRTRFSKDWDVIFHHHNQERDPVRWLAGSYWQSRRILFLADDDSLDKYRPLPWMTSSNKTMIVNRHKQPVCYKTLILNANLADIVWTRCGYWLINYLLADNASKHILDMVQQTSLNERKCVLWIWTTVMLAKTIYIQQYPI